MGWQKSGRRQFLAASGGWIILRPETVFGTQANSAVEVGIVGCGGRGNWIGPFFPEYAGARIVALADVVRRHLEETRIKFNVDASRAYYGPDAYRELANSKLDAVVIQTPTYFHPEQVRAAIEAGKHVFVAKPVAVDVPGCKSILESARLAREKGLTLLVDFQTRAQPVFQESVERFRRGDIGKAELGQVFYFAGRPAKDRSKPGMDPGLARVLNFYMDRELGGDIIVEQNIHVIDLANWYLDAHPLRAIGTGGRTDWRGTDYDAGNAWDHFIVTFWYPNDVEVAFSSHQLTRSFSDLCVRLFGIKGAVDSHYGGLVRITGDNAWLGTEKDDTFRQGAINNVKLFVESIRSGKPFNNAEESVRSNLTCILGRMAAYQERMVTWEEMMKSEERYEVELALRW
jgi:predicted dehydrogenase